MERTRPVQRIEIGTRESALCTLCNIERAIGDLREVRRHVRGDHKRKIDNAITVYRIIALETGKMYAISSSEAEEAMRSYGQSWGKVPRKSE